MTQSQLLDFLNGTPYTFDAEPIYDLLPTIGFEMPSDKADPLISGNFKTTQYILESRSYINKDKFGNCKKY